MGAAGKLKAALPAGLRKRLGDARRRLRARESRTRAHWGALLEDPSLSDGERELLRATDSAIFFNDGMYTGDGAHYFRTGLGAVRLVEEALGAAGLSEVRRVLDLPCGGGRVLRFLARRFPGAEFTACDLQREAVDFCARRFGAEADYSQPRLDELTFPREFDLAWCGSLVTHLDAGGIEALLGLFRRSLAPGGLAVFTAHGERAVRRMTAREFDYGIRDADIAPLVAAYRGAGYGFADYPGDSGYGVSLTSPEWVRGAAARAGGLREVYFKPQGWDEHQDVYGFVRAD
jgi:SAM-dependent methyltransferase